MNNNKFTIGPWETLSINYNQHTSVWDNTGLLLIADVFGSDLAEKEANVKLICIAPDMYELICKVRGKIAEHISDSHDLEFEIESIISKIDGSERK